MTHVRAAVTPAMTVKDADQATKPVTLVSFGKQFVLLLQRLLLYVASPQRRQRVDRQLLVFIKDQLYVVHERQITFYMA